MKKVIYYDCEICGSRHDTPKSALQCEARGYGEIYPIGCIYGDHSKDAFYGNITFAVARNDVWDNEVGHVTYLAHVNSGASWACRDNGCGDSLDKNLCGGRSLNLEIYNEKDLDKNHPTFKRMVAYLKSKNIPIRRETNDYMCIG